MPLLPLRHCHGDALHMQHVTSEKGVPWTHADNCHKLPVCVGNQNALRLRGGGLQEATACQVGHGLRESGANSNGAQQMLTEIGDRLQAQAIVTPKSSAQPAVGRLHLLGKEGLRCEAMVASGIPIRRDVFRSDVKTVDGLAEPERT